MHTLQSNDHVRNPDGIWINSAVFREEAIHFTKYGIYTPEPPGSSQWMEYWEEQLRRCKEGYEVSGVKITGHHYFYLNFIQIMLVKETKSGKVAEKTITFPDFWDGDFNFFWALDIARNGISEQGLLDLKLHLTIEPQYLEGGHHMIVGKSRRKGYSYKNAAICANIYNTERKSLTIIGAFDKKFLYPRGTMGMASEYLSFLNKNTAWAKAREFVDKQDHKRASFIENIGGVKNEAGYLSEIMAITFGDNPDAARGKDAKLVLFEEAGAFENLRASFMATQPGLTAGKYITGQIVIFGTGGDMEGGTQDFADMFYNPAQYSIMPFTNIWDEDAQNSNCGFFHPVHWNMEGYYDEQGNSDEEGAKLAEEETKKTLLKNASNSLVVQQRVQEYPTKPAEAFLTVSTNNFPVIELRNRLNKVVRENIHIKKGQPVFLFRDETGKISARPDLDNELEPIWDYNPKTKNLNGAVVIYEYPQSNCPRFLYKIGFDPYRQEDGTSLASIIVYKGVERGSFTRDQIVAEYIGRPSSSDEVSRIAEMLAELYNTEVMYENEVTHVKTYFTRKKKLHLLAAQPDRVISKNVKNSKVARIWGCHMNDQLKSAGEKYIKEWLITERDFDENGEVLTNIDYINNPAFLDELIRYNRKGNFDRVMSFMMVMFQVQEEEEGKEYKAQDKENSNEKKLADLIQSQYKNSSSKFNNFA